MNNVTNQPNQNEPAFQSDGPYSCGEGNVGGYDLGPLEINPFPLIATIATVVFAALVVLAFVFFPLAAAIPFLIIGAVALSLGIGLTHEAEVVKKRFLPSSKLALKGIAFVNGGHSDYYNSGTNATLRQRDGLILRGLYLNILHEGEDNTNRQLNVVFNNNRNYVTSGFITGSDGYIQVGPDEYMHNREQTYDGVAVFNYRGCGTSEGLYPTTEQLINDGIDIVNAMINEQGFSLENITLSYANNTFIRDPRESIGQTVAEGVKEHFDEEHPEQEINITDIDLNQYRNSDYRAIPWE